MMNETFQFPKFGRPIVFSVCMLAHALGQTGTAQKDTVAITLAAAEQRFLQNNLQLLASKLRIDAAKAAKVQAEVWSNPNIAVEQNIYNQYTGKWFDVTSSGNSEIQIQQLFLLAGKRDKQIKLCGNKHGYSGTNFFRYAAGFEAGTSRAICSICISCSRNYRSIMKASILSGGLFHLWN